jgi:uncharacterized protein YlxW (UPF0749 family)
MSRIIRTFIACFSLVVFACLAQVTMAASVSEERARLAALQQSLQKQEADLQEMQTELETYPEKISAAEADVRKAEEDLAAERRLLQDLQGRSGESPEIDREIPIKEHAIRMAQRRVRSENRMLERYQRFHDDLQEEIAEAQQDAARLKQRIAQQNARIAEAQQQSQRAAAAAARSAPAPEPVAVEPAEEVATEVVTAEPTAEEEAPVEEPVSEQAPALSLADYQAFQTASEAMQRLEQAIARNPSGGPRYSSLQLTGSDISNVPFSHLGADQYRAEVVLPSGRHRFRIDSLRFQADISADNAGETYVFLVDASDRARLRATYFKESLLTYLGQQPVLANETSVTEDKEVELQTVTLASGKTVQLSEDDVYALEIAREHTLLLKEFALESNTSKPFFSSLTLSGNLMETAEFRHLGQDQYQAEIIVQSGRQTIRINRSTFRINIPDADEGETYLFFVDATRPTRLQVTYYKKSILDYL